MLKIRQAQYTDAKSLSTLAQDCSNQQSSVYNSDYLPSYQPSDFSQYYIALAETPQLVGFYQLDFIAKEETAVSLFFVAPGTDNSKGFANDLFKHAKIQARILGAKRLLIASNNLAELLHNQEIETTSQDVQQVSGNTAIHYAISLIP